jgi:hygromycin-B 4-O-kinase
VSRGTATDVRPDQVREFLRERFGAQADRVTRIEHGHWSSAFVFDRGRRRLVVRFGAGDADFRKDMLVARHGSRTFPVPELIEIGEAFGGNYALSEYIEGCHVDDIDVMDLRRVLPDLFATLDRVRDLDLSGTVGYGDWRGDDGNADHPTWRSYLLDVGSDRPAARTAGWRRRLAGSTVGTALFDDTCRAFERLVDGVPEGRHLVHGDILNYNTLVSKGAVAALLDWGWAKYGDFLYDVARLCFWAADYPRWRGVDFPAEALAHYRATGAEVPGFEHRLRCYQVHVGLSAQVHRAFRGQWVWMEAIGRRTLELATRSG